MDDPTQMQLFGSLDSVDYLGECGGEVGDEVVVAVAVVGVVIGLHLVEAGLKKYI